MKNTVKNILKIMLTVLLAVVIIPSSARTIEAAEQSETLTGTSGTWTGTYFSVSGHYSALAQAMELSQYYPSFTVSSNSGENQKSIKKITLNHASNSNYDNKATVSANPTETNRVYDDNAKTATYTFEGNVTSVTFSTTSNGADVASVIVYYDDGSTSTYSVTLSGGANATASGSTSQTVTAGQAMNTVTYTASTNYCFDNFTDIESNGVKAERTNSTTVTVSGTPTGDVEITVPDALKKVKVITDDTYGQDKGGIVAGIFTEDDDKYVLCSKNSDGKYVINVVPSTGYSFGNASTYVILGVEYDTANNQILFSDETVNSVDITFYKPLKIDFGSGHTELLKKLVKEIGGDARIDGTCMTFDPRYYEENNAYLYQANMTYSFISMIKSELEGKCVDNGECFFYIGRKAEYNSDDEIAEEKADKTTKVKDIVSAGGSFYMCWYDYSCSGDIVWTKGNTGSKEFEFKRNICDKGFAFGGEDVDVPPGLILASTYDLRGTVKIDDTYVTDKVTFSEGSLVVSVPDTVLNDLSVGTHTIKVLFEDNLEASKAFTIEDAAEGGGDSSEIIYRLPKTGIE